MLMQGFVMSTLKITLGPLGILAAAIVIAQEPPALSRAKALDQEIEKAKDLPMMSGRAPSRIWLVACADSPRPILWLWPLI